MVQRLKKAVILLPLLGLAVSLVPGRAPVAFGEASAEEVCVKTQEVLDQYLREEQELSKELARLRDADTYRDFLSTVKRAIATNGLAPLYILDGMRADHLLDLSKEASRLTIEERLWYQIKARNVLEAELARMPKPTRTKSELNERRDRVIDQMLDRYRRMEKLDCKNVLARDKDSGDTTGSPVKGAFGPPKKSVGHLPKNFDGPEHKIVGEMTPTSFTLTVERKPASEGAITITHTYNGEALGKNLKPGDIIELSCESSAQISGRYPPNIGGSCKWNVSGSVTFVKDQGGKEESTPSTFVGIAGDGKQYASGSSKTKFKVGSGGGITIQAVQGGYAWGEGSDNYNPVEFVYTFNP